MSDLKKPTREQVTQTLRLVGVLSYIASYILEKPDRTKSLFWWL